MRKYLAMRTQRMSLFLRLMYPLSWAQTHGEGRCMLQKPETANLGREQIKELKGRIASKGW